MLADRKSHFFHTVWNKSKNNRSLKNGKQKSTHPLMKWTEESRGRKQSFMVCSMFWQCLSET